MESAFDVDCGEVVLTSIHNQRQTNAMQTCEVAKSKHVTEKGGPDL